MSSFCTYIFRAPGPVKVNYQLAQQSVLLMGLLVSNVINESDVINLDHFNLNRLEDKVFFPHITAIMSVSFETFINVEGIVYSDQPLLLARETFIVKRNGL